MALEFDYKNVQFIHGIDLDDFYPCYNLVVKGRLETPDYLALYDKGMAEAHTSIKSVSIEYLRTQGVPIGAITPTSAWNVNGAAAIRRGHKLALGVDNPQFLSEKDTEGILMRGDIELEFEKVRREVAPNSSSRLTCIWLAENTPQGQKHVLSMLKGNIYIIDVRIVGVISITKSDTAWFDKYARDKNPEYIRNYWQSVPFDSNNPKWEYLLEGEVVATNSRQIDHIKKYGARLSNKS